MKYYCPQHLHKPIEIFFMEFEDLMVFFMSFLLLVIPLGFIGMLGSLFITFLYKKIKGKLPRGAVLHLFYYLTLYNFKRYPSSPLLIKEFRE